MSGRREWAIDNPIPRYSQPPGATIRRNRGPDVDLPRASRLCVVAALTSVTLLLPGCGDKDESQDEDGCEQDTGGPGSLEPLSDFSGTSLCTATSMGHVTLTGHSILYYETVGYTRGSLSSADPGSSNQGISTHRTTGSCPGATSTETRSLGTGLIDPDSASDIWHVGGGTESLNDCGVSCGTDDCTACSGQYEVRIVRPDEVARPRPEESNGTASAWKRQHRPSLRSEP